MTLVLVVEGHPDIQLSFSYAPILQGALLGLPSRSYDNLKTEFFVYYWLLKFL